MWEPEAGDWGWGWGRSQRVSQNLVGIKNATGNPATLLLRFKKEKRKEKCHFPGEVKRISNNPKNGHKYVSTIFVDVSQCSQAIIKSKYPSSLGPRIKYSAKI